MRNKAVLMIAAVIIAAAGVGTGYLLSSRVEGAAQGPDRMGFAQLSVDERAQLQNMSDTERQAFFKEKGLAMPGGRIGSPDSSGLGRRVGGLLEGTVTSVDAEKVKLALAAGGSATLYVDPETVIAAVEGADPKLVLGAKVMVSAQPEADGVNAARGHNPRLAGPKPPRRPESPRSERPGPMPSAQRASSSAPRSSLRDDS